MISGCNPAGNFFFLLPGDERNCAKDEDPPNLRLLPPGVDAPDVDSTDLVVVLSPPPKLILLGRRAWFIKLTIVWELVYSMQDPTLKLAMCRVCTTQLVLVARSPNSLEVHHAVHPSDPPTRWKSITQLIA